MQPPIESAPIRDDNPLRDDNPIDTTPIGTTPNRRGDPIDTATQSTRPPIDTTPNRRGDPIETTLFAKKLSQPGQPVPAERPDPTSGNPERLPTWRLVLAIMLPVTAIIAVVALAAVVNSRPVSDVSGPLTVAAVDAPGATTAACTTLMAALPDPLGQLPRRQLDHGSDPQLTGVAAWGEPAAILRCGVPTPTELTCSALVQEVDGVAWLPLSGTGATTYLVVDRPVRVALTMPEGAGTGPWQELSKIIGATLTKREICIDGVPVPPEGG